MSFQQYHSLISAARPAVVNLISRFISRNNGFKQCSQVESDRSQADIKVSELNTSAKCQSDVNDALNTTRLSCNQQFINLSDKNSLDDREVTLPNPFDTCTEDLSDIGPYLTPTFSFAKYANKSRTIQEFIKLGVALYKLESQEGMVQYILGLDFEKDVKPYIRFLHDCGVPADYLGEFLTKNPEIFREDMDDLHTRIRYLRAHGFSRDMITTILCKNPNWLRHSTKDIDGRLGYFQHSFKLNGNEVRILTVKGPKVVTYKMLHLMSNTFTIKEEMGFDKYQMKRLLLKIPRIWTKNRTRLLDTFEYAHNIMQLQQDFIVKMPQILSCRRTRLQQRHLFLVEMKRAQYDPSKPMYISPLALISGSDLDFCRNIAKTSVEVYNEFLKTCS